MRDNNGSQTNESRISEFLVLLLPVSTGLCGIYFVVIGLFTGAQTWRRQRITENVALSVIDAYAGTPFRKAPPTPTPTPRPTPTPIGPPVSLDDYEELFDGVFYQRQESASPRRHTAHVLIIDLNDPHIELMVTPEKGLGQTSSGFLETYGVQLAINGDGWGLGYDPHGLAASEGKVYSEASREPTIYIFKNGKVKIGGAPPARIWGAISGSHTLVEKGRLSTKIRTCAIQAVYCQHLAPRTSIGISAGNYLIIIVVEGPPSAPRQALTLEELARLHRQLGSVDAIALDGGGSSTMVVDNSGTALILNSPTDGTERTVANHLGIFARNRANSSEPGAAP